MASLALDTLECIISIICSQCSSQRQLAGPNCIDLECGPECPAHGTQQQERLATLAALCLTSRRELAKSQAGRAILVNSRDALLLMASLCPNLGELDGYFYSHENLKEPATLQKLNTITLAYEYHEFVSHAIRELVPLVDMAPNLVKLAAGRVLRPAGDVALTLPKLEHLRLDDSDLDQALLSSFLSSCPRLLSFDYRTISSRPLPDPEDEPHFTPREAQEIFLSRIPHLKALRMDLRHAKLSHPLVGAPHLLRDLRGLMQLETLSVDTRCLFPDLNPDIPGNLALFEGEDLLMSEWVLVDLLPSSICNIRIFGGTEEGGSLGSCQKC